MPTGGRITIETRNVTLDRDYVRSQEDEIAAGDYVMLSVTDTGGGMPPEVVKRAFEPFFTTKDGRQGDRPWPQHGLWLHQAVERPYQDLQRGRPRNDREDVFPAQRRAGRRRRRRPGTRRLPGGTERILVVEDEDAVRTIVGEQLRGLGYDVKLAGDADKALALLRAHQFDLC